MRHRDRPPAPVRVRRLTKHHGWAWYCRNCFLGGIHIHWADAIGGALLHLAGQEKCRADR